MTVIENDILIKLAELIENLKRPALPLSVELWDTKEIGTYLHRSVDRVYSDIVCLPTFPKPIRLPVKGRAHALYKAREVIAWAEKHQS